MESDTFLNAIFNFCSQGKKIKCSTSQAKHRLFIGNVPRNWKEGDLRKVVTEIGPGVTTIELVRVYTSVLCFLSHCIFRRTSENLKLYQT